MDHGNTAEVMKQLKKALQTQFDLFEYQDKLCPLTPRPSNVTKIRKLWDCRAPLHHTIQIHFHLRKNSSNKLLTMLNVCSKNNVCSTWWETYSLPSEETHNWLPSSSDMYKSPWENSTSLRSKIVTGSESTHRQLNTWHSSFWTTRFRTLPRLRIRTFCTSTPCLPTMPYLTRPQLSLWVSHSVTRTTSYREKT